MEPETKPKPSKYSEARLELYGRLAWFNDYEPIYLLEAQMNGAAAAVEHYQSDYRRQQLSAGNEDARRKSMLRISQDYERLLREQDCHYVPFSQAIKSAMWCIDQVKTAAWEKERKDKKVAGRTYGMQLLWKMIDVRPDPEEKVNEDVSFAVFDQVNIMAGGGHGHGSKKFNGIGRFDEKGKRVEVQRETYVNIFDVHVSASDCILSDAAREVISRRGPYTQDFSRILPIMAPERADTFMDEMLVSACTSLRGLTKVRLRPAYSLLVPPSHCRDTFAFAGQRKARRPGIDQRTLGSQAAQWAPTAHHRPGTLDENQHRLTSRRRQDLWTLPSLQGWPAAAARDRAWQIG